MKKKRTPKEKYYVFYEDFTEDGPQEWELDAEFPTLKQAEEFALKQCRTYRADDEEEESSRWRFHILKSVRVIDAQIKVTTTRELILK